MSGMQMADVLVGFSLFVDGRGYAGRVAELKPPVLERITDEFRGGGMDSSIDVDLGGVMKKAEYTLGEYNADILKLWRLETDEGLLLRFKGSVKPGVGKGDEYPVEMVMRGKHKKFDMGTWKAGDRSTLKAELSLHYYKLSIKGEIIHEIDVPNGVWIVDGVDMLAARRKNLGI